MVIKKTLFFSSAAFLGLIIGIKSAIALLKYEINAASIKNDVWLYNPYVGSDEASGLTRAAVAVIGFLGMTKEESLYFIAKTDSHNQILSGQCNYTVSGVISNKDARWWSITLYNAETDKLIANSENRYSFSGDTIELSPDGRFTFTVSPDEQQGNWLPVQENVEFDLTLRLYNPNKAIVESPNSYELPTVVRESCK